MKKYLTLILALALVLGLSVPAFAANETEKRTDLSFVYEVAEPIYTVTIPGSLALKSGGNAVPITVSDADDLNGKAVRVSIESTNYGSRICLVRVGAANPTSLTQSSDHIFATGEIRIGEKRLALAPGPSPMPTESIGGGFYNFYANETLNLTFSLPTELAIPNEVYTGYIIFGISLV